MNPRVGRSIGALVVAATLLAGCGLDDGARVRNQDNVRDADPSEVDS